ncbi:hypothetical protein T4A_12558 [Trichinella pseudospiralis]|uniref:Uncharacterized protein n=1 Tax=Trichinella pseudospiralis TaxID=6337 RepID=A0A0V1AJQ0_TRIPS|nr:hypothetical protein T4A_12558 [Trichinella pseudospiralis]
MIYGNVSGFLLLSANMTKTKAEQHNIFIYLFI